MKENVFLFCALVLALSVVGCRSHRHVQSTEVIGQRDSIHWSSDIQRESSSSSLFSTSSRSDRNTWRITWHFDTSMPSDPETRLPPVSSIEVEGEEQTQEDHSSAEDVSQEAEDIQEEGTGVGDVDIVTTEDRDTEAGDKLGRLFEYVIPLTLLIVVLLLIYRDVGRDSSK